ncbi:16S rRNA (guanine(527)-N(7))-methyltransferase RsmG [Roseivivax sp. GX 12232]|uniref:16S rRNA (guanine(527)-N(7))-methyltransferase RsmG n=1 Tax=Roseivivax sp. GX 12232 TaxID=2900547 RepID=UPI001E659BD1|nr:16S rRNA (guanine(527)-N(7))-methyltransferase RsmG [Roseivivax sp. GX 12232]MCE0506287.1 16S rRNA (guanine(527)-N(7))-methyltransferase RsmG [Roseivivax sp. GX 12232]
MSELFAGRHVSRETAAALTDFEALVHRWNPRINLVSRRSLADLRDRHIGDSLQLAGFLPQSGLWLDLGSGGGFPALVLAILAKETAPELNFRLVESDSRKCVFLRTAIRELSLNAEVKTARIEALPPQHAQVVSARALADLSTLLGLAAPHMAPGARALFPKGVTWEKELAEARATWSFACTTTRSETDPQSVILDIGDVVHV